MDPSELPVAWVVASMSEIADTVTSAAVVAPVETSRLRFALVSPSTQPMAKAAPTPVLPPLVSASASVIV